MASSFDFVDRITFNLKGLRKQNPLIHNITNYVASNYVANVLLAAGASPAMAHAEEEVEEMVSLADALVLNIGTLSSPWIRAMHKAGNKATELGKPVVLDPAGSGATTLRTATVKEILAQAKVTVLRGNVSEMLSLSEANTTHRGLDAMHSLEEAVEILPPLAQKLCTTLAVTGETDLVSDGRRSFKILGGHPLMPIVTGTGCALSGLVGALLAVDNDPVFAAVTALALFAVAGEKAGARALGPGSFAMHFLDTLYNLTPQEVARESRILVV